MVRVKICGNTNSQDVGLAIELKADYLGFVFAPSKRRISVLNARRIIDEFPRFQNFVGVFADQLESEVERTAADLNLEWLQFHGKESNDYCSRFRTKGYHVIKAIPIKDASSINKILDYEADAFLLDTYSAEKKGGSGKTFDWSLVGNVPSSRAHLFLAGGLNIQNVALAIQTVQPDAVDVASGVEKIPGVKDPKLLKQFIEIAKSVGVVRVEP